MTFVRVALNGGGLLVEAHDGADAFAQVLVGEADGIADEEVRTLRPRWRWRWRWRWR
ncbi:hypothetical protein D3C72_1491310 [compost metagenome]